MKKTYTQPAIELVEVAIEQGIAQSVQTTTFGLKSATIEEDVW